MENMINIAEILKDCPNGMELDSPNYNGVIKFEEVTKSNMYPIKISITHNNMIFTNTLTKYGQTYKAQYHKCVIFPKGKTTWEGFQRPFKDGDVCTGKVNGNLVIFIYKERINITLIKSHFVLYVRVGFCKNCCIPLKDEEIKFATEEEKQELFKAIQDNGYRWDAETKTLRVVGKLGKLKFKIGDIIQDKDGYKVRITEVNTDDALYKYESLFVKGTSGIPFENENNWKLVPNKFDITTLKPFDRVLMRSSNAREWDVTLFSHYSNDKFYGCGMCCDQCIPYEGNEHLLGTTNDCDDFYINW